MLYNSKGQKVFEMELVENTDDKGILKFHTCPLNEAWKEHGLTKEVSAITFIIFTNSDKSLEL